MTKSRALRSAGVFILNFSDINCAFEYRERLLIDAKIRIAPPLGLFLGNEAHGSTDVCPHIVIHDQNSERRWA